MANARDALNDCTDNRRKRIDLISQQEASGIIIRVTDNGLGIPPDHYNRIFRPFFTTKEADKGTGLGLSISYAIIKHHNGQITFKSEPDKGTTFSVLLPANTR